MIVLVPGHSPDSPGACGGGLCEWPWANTVMHMVGRKLPESQVIQRKSGLNGLVETINDLRPEAVISLHLNAFDGTVSGCETLHYPSSEEGEGLARELQIGLVHAVGNQDRGVKPRRDLAILSDTTVPAVLLEPAFVDNVTDRKYALRNADLVADAIEEGIRRWR
jgi:N-acetylmuramoyl-L-alanine amidase